MDYKIRILKKPDDLSLCFDVRCRVFVDEQKFDKDIEIDEIDDYAYHVLITLNEIAIGAARFFKENDYYKVGRVCVLKKYRKYNIGSEIMRSIENEVIKLNGSKIILSSQLQARDFYEKNGYTLKGEVYLEEECEHIKMIKEVKS